MSWELVILLVLGTYLLRASGFVLLGKLYLPPLLVDMLSWAPAALVAALIAFGSVGGDGGVTFDARAAGVAAALVAALLRAPFLVIFLAAVVVTAVVRFVA